MHANQPDRNHDPIELTEGLEDLSLDDDDLDDDDEDVDGEPGTRRRRRRLRDLLKPQPRKKLSEILQDLMIDPARDTISVGDLLREMDARAFGALLLVFAFPNVLPAPPGLAGILGLPLIYLSSQLMLGRMPWLPGFIVNRSLTRESYSSLVSKATPWLARAERMLTQRLTFLVSPSMEKLLGAVCLFLSLILVLPIPFGNMLPAIAICVIALGILERDGLWVLIGLLASVIAVGIVGSFAYALIKSMIFVLMGAF
jgi:hypothetical protein